MLARRLCAGCGLDWNLLAHRPKVADVCDMCGSALVVREDDNPEALAVRLRDYHEKTSRCSSCSSARSSSPRSTPRRSIAEIQAEIRDAVQPAALLTPASAGLTASSRPDAVAVTPLVHDGGMTSTTTSTTPEQLTLLPDAAAVPVQFRLDEATRRRGLRHVAEIRARLERPTADERPTSARRPAA